MVEANGDVCFGHAVPNLDTRHRANEFIAPLAVAHSQFEAMLTSGRPQADIIDMRYVDNGPIRLEIFECCLHLCVGQKGSIRVNTSCACEMRAMHLMRLHEHSEGKDRLQKTSGEQSNRTERPELTKRSGEIAGNRKALKNRLF